MFVILMLRAYVYAYALVKTRLYHAATSENGVDISTSMSTRPSARFYVLMLMSLVFSLAHGYAYAYVASAENKAK